MKNAESPESTLNLPELQNALLDTATVAQLLRDIELCAHVTEIIPKFLPHTYVPETTISLPQAREWLFGNRVRGVQIRYRYDGGEWWDTLLRANGMFRLVRIRHDFST